MTGVEGTCKFGWCGDLMSNEPLAEGRCQGHYETSLEPKLTWCKFPSIATYNGAIFHNCRNRALQDTKRCEAHTGVEDPPEVDPSRTLEAEGPIKDNIADFTGTLQKLKDDLVQLCTEFQDGTPDGVIGKLRSVYKQSVHCPQWSTKTQHIQHKVNGCLWNFYAPDIAYKVNVADGLMDEAIKVDTEERAKGVVKPIDKTPSDASLYLLEDAINMDNWLYFHGEGNIGPSWWMDNREKDKDDWKPHEMAWLNKALHKRDGQMVGDTHVFRFLGKGSYDRGKWQVSPGGYEYLFAIFTLDNDPRKISDDSFDINLERWLDAYGETKKPARCMTTVEGRSEQMALNKQLKALDGTSVRGTHIFRFSGRITYKREGKRGLFHCEPINLAWG